MLRLSTAIFAVLAICTIAVATTSSSVFAARESSMTFEQMASEAKHVWAGVVTNVESKEHDQEGFLLWKNRHYQITVNVTDVAKTRGFPDRGSMYHHHEKSEQVMRHHEEKLPPHEGEGSVEHPDHVRDELYDDETIKVGDEIHVHFWRALQRPPGYKLPDSPGSYGMRSDIVLEEGQKFAFFGEYLHRDHVRRSMYRHTHPGKVRRRKHASGTGDGAEEFSFVKAYVAFIPDGVTEDVEGALAAASGIVGAEEVVADKTDL